MAATGVTMLQGPVSMGLSTRPASRRRGIQRSRIIPRWSPRLGLRREEQPQRAGQRGERKALGVGANGLAKRMRTQPPRSTR